MYNLAVFVVAGLRKRWFPAVIAAVAVGASLAGWAYMVLERRSRIQDMAEVVASQSGRTVSTAVRNHASALLNLAGFWAVVGQRPFEEWRAAAELVIDGYPQIDYIAWIRPDGRGARVAAGRLKSEQGIEIEPERARELGSERRLIGPERDELGSTVLRVLLPVRRGSPDLGVLEARIKIEALLADALQESAPGYAIRVYWGGERIFGRGEPASGNEWWRTESTVSLPFDTRWTMRHRPTPELAAAWLTPEPHYLLAAGFLLSIALGVLGHQLRLSALHARALAAGNQALKASAGELRELNEVLEQRVRERTQELEAFTHSISHDLRSPLGSILNFASILELDYRQSLDEDGMEFLTRIRRSAVRGTEMLEGLLRLSRAGHANLQIAKIDMEFLARESFNQTRQSDMDSDVEFAMEPLPEAYGDEVLIREVLVNLFDNALKYSRGREKRRVVIRGQHEAGESIYEIEDNGRGFDMRDAGKLFRLFERLHSFREIEGTGVGLALVARIVSRHRGRCWAESRPDEGARFFFSLPWSTSS